MLFSELRDRHLRQHAFVAGKGPHLDRIEEIRDDLSQCGPILCCNESVHRIASLGLEHATVYGVQQDSSLKDRCATDPTKATHLMSCWQLVKQKSGPAKLCKVQKSEWSPHAILYDPIELGQHYCHFTAVVACAIAKFMGCTSLTFICFDSWASAGTGQYAECIGSPDTGNNDRHAIDGRTIRRNALEFGFDSVAVRFPEIQW